MNLPKIIRRLQIATALLAVLFFATTAGELLHHHQNDQSEAHCPICHLSHQSVEQAAGGQGASAPELLGSLPDPPKTIYLASPRTLRLHPRAPPSA